jgi:hypothetical protein
VIRTGAAVRAAGVIGVLSLALTGCDGAGSGDNPSPSPSASRSGSGSAAGKGAVDPAQTLPARWWSWAAAAPAGKNPISDTTGEYCTQGQPKDVWFLAGSFGEEGIKRQCTVPADRPVYFPLINRVCTMPAGQTTDKAIKGCRVLNRSLFGSVDGDQIMFAEADSGGSFRLDPAPGNEIGVVAGDAVAWGVWAGPLKLSPGKHTVEISAYTPEFEIGVEYDLTVTP